MVAPEANNTSALSSTKLVMISNIQHLPLVRQESFLRQKYQAEGRNIAEISSLTFSSRSTIVKYLEAFKIPIRAEDRQIGTLPFGKRWHQRRIANNARELDVIHKARQLRDQGLSYEKVASILNTMNVRTKTGRSKWYPKTVRDITLRDLK